MNDLRNASPQVKRFLAGALLNSLGEEIKELTAEV
jgi:hypothetical protein